MSDPADAPASTQIAAPSWRHISVRDAFAHQPSPPDADWRWWESLGVLAAAFILSTVLAALVVDLLPKSEGGEFLANAVADLMLLVVLVGWLQLLHPGWAARMGLPTNRGLDIAAGVTVGIGLHVVALLLQNFALLPLLNLINGGEVPAPVQVGPGLTVAGLAMAGFFAIIIAPVTEEFFFRGVLFRAFRSHHGFILSGLASGILFGAIHLLSGQPFLSSVLLMVPLAFVGFGFAWVMERRGTLLAAICAHVAFNVTGFIGIVIDR